MTLKTETIKEFARTYLANYKATSTNNIQPYFKKNFSYDLLYDGLKYKVKYSKPAIFHGKKYWDFDVRNSNPSDYYLMIGLIDDKPEKVFLVPDYAIYTDHLRVAVKGKSKYLKYEI